MSAAATLSTLTWIAASSLVAVGLRTSDAAESAGPAALRVYADCMRAMAESRCVAASPAARVNATAAPQASVVFVAGAGVVPGDVYRALVQADAGMCEMVRAACTRQPQGQVCATAGRLW